MKKLLFPMLCALVLAGTLSSCKYFPVDPPDPVDPGPDTVFVNSDLVNTSWKLESYGLVNRQAHPVQPDGMFSLKFSSVTEAGGTADCNGYTVEYKSDGKNISFNTLRSTGAVCENPFDYYAALGTASSYMLEGNHLRIIYDNGTKQLLFSPMLTQPATPNYIQMLPSFENVKFKVDPFRILDIQKTDETHLMITVEYGGGCHDNHEFVLYGSRNFMPGNATDWADIMLTHEANDDMCDALITKTLVYDMTPLIKAHKETGSGNRLVLRFSQYGDQIVFTDFQ